MLNIKDIKKVVENNENYHVKDYLVNDTMTIPVDDENRDYRVLKEWLKYNRPLKKIGDIELKKREHKAVMNKLKTEGMEFSYKGTSYGYVSFTKNDADAVMFLFSLFGIHEEESTMLKLSNGNSIFMDNELFKVFFPWFLEKRNMFFKG